MARKIFITIFLFLTTLISLPCLAQESKTYYPMKKGQFIEYTFYDAKDNVTGYSRQTVKNIVNTPKGFKLSAQSDHLDAKGNVDVSCDIYMRSENDVFYFDIRNMLDPKTLEVFGDNEVEITGIDVGVPFKMSVGQSLPDAEMTIKVKMSDVPLPPMVIRVYNRHVDLKEKITIPTGTFNCYKISYEIEIKSIITSRMKGVEWITDNLGVLKTESYNKKGKLIGKSILTKSSK